MPVRNQKQAIVNLLLARADHPEFTTATNVVQVQGRIDLATLEALITAAKAQGGTLTADRVQIVFPPDA